MSCLLLSKKSHRTPTYIVPQYKMFPDALTTCSTMEYCFICVRHSAVSKMFSLEFQIHISLWICFNQRDLVRKDIDVPETY